MSLALAILNLQTDLATISGMHVDNVDVKPGSPAKVITIVPTTQVFEQDFGVLRKLYSFRIKVTSKIAIDASAQSEIVKAVDEKIIADRRRGGYAQTTMLDDAGWDSNEPEGKDRLVMEREIVIAIYTEGAFP